MPDETILRDAAHLLSAQLLQEARSDTARGWAARALCADWDPAAFFPPGDDATQETRDICAACPVRAQCLAYAVTANERFGIWGGLDPQERHTLRKRLQRHGLLPPAGTGTAA